MWVINIQDWLNDTKTGPATPRLRLKVKKLAEIITYVTSEIEGIPTEFPPVCWRRPKRKPCKSILDISFDPITKRIYWYCNICKDEGVVSGWEGLIWDMLDFPDGEKIH